MHGCIACRAGKIAFGKLANNRILEVEEEGYLPDVRRFGIAKQKRLIYDETFGGAKPT